MVTYDRILDQVSDPDGESFSFVDGMQSQRTVGGTVNFKDPSRTLVYTSRPDFTGVDSFDVKVKDLVGAATLSVSVQVIPRDKVSPTHISYDESGVVINFSRLPAATYTFERSDNLSNWTTLDTFTVGVDGNIQLVDAASSFSAYYRIKPASDSQVP